MIKRSGGGRISSIETLRLLSMLMVLNLHSFKGYDYGSGLGQALDFFRESTSICAVNVFILISGYFSIKWKKKSFYNLVFQLFFYSFGVYAFCVAIGFIPFEKGQFLKCFLALSSSWGFVKNYLILYFFAPILNEFSERQSSKSLLIYIAILFIAENFVFMSYDAINFLLIYLIGRWLRKYDAINKNKTNAAFAYLIVTILIFVSSYSVFLLFHFKAEIMTRLVIAFSYSSPLVILQSVFLFLFFARMEFHSRIVNWAAESCLAIFLIHMHPAIKQVGYYQYTEGLYLMPFFSHVGILIGLIFSVFIGSILIDKIRIMISDLIYNTLLRYLGTKISKEMVLDKGEIFLSKLMVK